MRLVCPPCENLRGLKITHGVALAAWVRGSVSPATVP